MSTTGARDEAPSAGHVLIIEDDEDARLVATMSLQGIGWVVSSAATGSEGVAMALGVLPEVIICDRMLPDIDGLGVIALLAANPSTASIPVLLTTSMGTLDDIVDGIDAGAHDYLVKPFRMIELEVRCRAALRVSRQHRRLARSEQALRILTENTTELVLRRGMDGLIRYASPSAKRVLGWDPDELVGRAIATLCHPDDDAAWRAVGAAMPGEVVAVARRMLRVDGTYIWVDLRAQLVRGPDGDPEILSAARDITDRLAAAAALAESEGAYRRIVDLAAEGVCVVDADQTITFANSRMGEILGVGASELVGRSPLEFMDDEGRAIHAGRVERHRAGIGEAGDSKFLRPDGSPVWTSFNAAPIVDDDGVFQGSVALISDVTERHQHEAALASAEERWRAAFERAPVGMAQIGVDGRFSGVNPALCEMLGYSADELRVLMPADISHPDDAGAALRMITDLLVGTVQHHRAERRFLHARGQIVWCAVNAVPIHDADGRVGHVLVHFLDISDLKRAETDLRDLSEHDPLTGLLNRRGFDDALGRHVAHVARYGPSGALLVLDLDGLKLINDTRGHEAGDRAIAAVAEVLRRRLRTTDTIARLGGDEFAVIVPHVDREQAEAVAASLVATIRRELGSLEPGHLGPGRLDSGRVELNRSGRGNVDPGFGVTASIGVAMFDVPGRSAIDVLADADRTMYAAKNEGRDRYAISRRPPHPRTGA